MNKIRNGIIAAIHNILDRCKFTAGCTTFTNAAMPAASGAGAGGTAYDRITIVA